MALAVANDRLSEIYEVAIYLRKSRDESNGEEDILAKHEKELTDIAKNNGWRYIIYREIGSSDSIDYRPEMVKLLKDVENDLFDAVLVADYDRLGRGDMEDQGRIKRIFRQSSTYIITPSKLYNLSNDNEELMIDFEGLMARYEYKMIKKRLQRGKKLGAKLGLWTNGKPPLPYVYNRITKTLEVDEEKLKVYNLIKQRFFDGKPCYEISWELNKMGIPSPGGKLWSENAVRRILISEVHLGQVIYGKTTGSGHKNRKVDPLTQKSRDEWIIAEGQHSALKTQEEHAEILATMERRKIIPKKARSGVYILSGLVYCGVCGSTLRCWDKGNGKMYIRTCNHADPYGNRCKNRGLDVEIIYTAIDEYLERYEDLIRNEKPKENTKHNSLQMLFELRKKELAELQQGLERIDDLYIMGRLNRQQVKEKVERQNDLIRRKQEEIQQVQDSLGHFNGMSNAERLQRITDLKKVWHDLNVSSEEKNRLAKQIIDRISYVRLKKDAEIKVDFL